MNPLFNRKIDAIEQSVLGYSLGEALYSEDGDNALKVNRLATNTDIEWKILFELSALKPWEYTQRFRLKFVNWWNDYIQDKAIQNAYLLNISDNEFLKPFNANISLIGPGSLPELWTLQEYSIKS